MVMPHDQVEVINKLQQSIANQHKLRQAMATESLDNLQGSAKIDTGSETGSTPPTPGS